MYIARAVWRVWIWWIKAGMINVPWLIGRKALQPTGNFSLRDIPIKIRPISSFYAFQIPSTLPLPYIIHFSSGSFCIIIILLYFDVCHSEAPRRKARETSSCRLRELWRKFLMRFCSRCEPTKRAFSTSSAAQAMKSRPREAQKTIVKRNAHCD